MRMTRWSAVASTLAVLVAGAVVLGMFRRSEDPAKVLERVRAQTATANEFRALLSADGRARLETHEAFEVLNLARSGRLASNYGDELARLMAASSEEDSGAFASACEALLRVEGLSRDSCRSVGQMIARYARSSTWNGPAAGWLASGRLLSEEVAAIVDARVPRFEIELATPDGLYHKGEVVRVRAVIRETDRGMDRDVRVSLSCKEAELRGACGAESLVASHAFRAEPLAWIKLPDRSGVIDLTFEMELQPDFRGSLGRSGMPLMGGAAESPQNPKCVRRVVKRLELIDNPVQPASLVDDQVAADRLAKWVWPGAGDGPTAFGPAESQSAWVKARIVTAAGWMVWRDDGKEVGRGWVVLESPQPSPGFARFAARMSAALPSGRKGEIWFEPDPEWMRSCREFKELFSGKAWQVYRRPDARWPVPADEW